MKNNITELIYRDKENFDYLLKETILEDIQEELLKYINGQKFVVPSVTQITNEVYPYINMGVKKEIIDKSIEQGNCVHEMISLSIDQRNNSSIKLTQNDCENKIHIQLANRIVTEINSLIYKFKIKKIYSENTFINFERPNYIGTPDILMDDGKNYYLIDIKTSRVNFVEKNQAQLLLYKNLIDSNLDKKVLKAFVINPREEITITEINLNNKKEINKLIEASFKINTQK